MTRVDTADPMPVELPTSRVGLFDPPAALGLFRQEGPVRHLRFADGHIGWLITSYDLGRAVLRDKRFGKDIAHPPLGGSPALRELLDPLGGGGSTACRAFQSGVITALDPPQHTRLRRLLAGHFTVRAMHEQQPHIELIVETQLRAVEQAGQPADLVEHFALPIPLLTICQLLGIPDSEREAVFAPMHGHSASHTNAEEDDLAAYELSGATLRTLIRHKRRQPADDLLSRLVVSGAFSEDELIGVAMLLAHAGGDDCATASMLAIGVLALLEEPQRWDALRTNTVSVEAVTEELMRYLTPVQLDAHTRKALEDVEVGGVTIHAGQRVHVSLPACNRDPERFDDPDLLDLARDARGHLTFGDGIHICLGQHLARIEIHVALTGLVRRFPTLRLAMPASEVPLPAGNAHLYAPCRLPVVW